MPLIFLAGALGEETEKSHLLLFLLHPLSGGTVDLQQTTYL